MDEKKLKELMKDENFVKELIAQDTPKQVKDLFQSRGFEISDSEIDLLGEALALCVDKLKKNGKISEEDLRDISGGGGRAAIATLITGVVLTGVLTAIGALGLGDVGNCAGRLAACSLGGGETAQYIAANSADFAGFLTGGAVGLRTGWWITKRLTEKASTL